MARMPAPCIRRLCVGGLPHASGNVSRTAVQYSSRAVHRPAKSVSPLLRIPVGEQAARRGGQALLQHVDDAGVGDHGLLALLLAGRRAPDQPAERRVRVAVQQVAQGRRGLAERQPRRQRRADLGQEFGDQAARQRPGVVDPQELVALQVDGVGDERVDRHREILPLWPGPAPGPAAGRRRSSRVCARAVRQRDLQGSGLAQMPSLPGPRLQVNRTVDGSAMMIGLGNSTWSPSR